MATTKIIKPAQPATPKIATRTDGALTVREVAEQIRAIQELYKEILQDGTHYGTVSGVKKPFLFKPGAEKVALLLQLSARYKETILDVDTTGRDFPEGHREYRMRCELYHRPTGEYVGEGVGSAGTLEAKYRYRYLNTGRPVPQDYWTTRDPNVLGGEQYEPRKFWDDAAGGSRWFVAEKIENPDIADVYNTVYKIAKKRAFIDAVINATACGDIFTQDEDTVASVMDRYESTPPIPTKNTEEASRRVSDLLDARENESSSEAEPPKPSKPTKPKAKEKPKEKPKAKPKDEPKPEPKPEEKPTPEAPAESKPEAPKNGPKPKPGGNLFENPDLAAIADEAAAEVDDEERLALVSEIEDEFERYGDPYDDPIVVTSVLEYVVGRHLTADNPGTDDELKKAVKTLRAIRTCAGRHAAEFLTYCRTVQEPIASPKEVGDAWTRFSGEE